MKKDEIINLMRKDSEGKIPDVFERITVSAQREGLLNAGQAASLGAAHASGGAGVGTTAGAAGGSKIILSSFIAALAVTAAVSGTVGASVAFNNYSQASDPPVIEAPENPVDPINPVDPVTPPGQLTETQGLEYEEIDGGYAVVGIGTATDTELVIPQKYNGKSVIKISEDAFRGNTSITSVTVQDSVQRIDIYAFFGCSALSEIVLPDTAISMSSYAFSGTAYKNDKSNWEDGLLYIGKHLVATETSAGYTIKSGTLTTAEDVLTVIPNSFAVHCITFNKELLLIETNHNFTSCEYEFKVEDGNARYKIINGCVVDVPAKTIILAGYQADIPYDGSVTKIGDNAFNDYKASQLIIPDCITELGVNAFNGGYFDSVVFPSSMTKISANAFYNTRITTLTIPSHVKEVGAYAFYKGIFSEVIIEDGVENIGDYAFQSSTLYDLYLPTQISLGVMSFYDSLNTITVNYDGTQNAYAYYIQSTITQNKVFSDCTVVFSGKLSNYDICNRLYVSNKQNSTARQLTIDLYDGTIRLIDTTNGNGFKYWGLWSIVSNDGDRLHIKVTGIDKGEMVGGKEGNWQGTNDTWEFDLYQKLDENSIDVYYLTCLLCTSGEYQGVEFSY